MEGAFSALRLGDFMRRARGKLVRMYNVGWYGQHRSTALCGYTTPSCFVAGAFSNYCYVGINIPSDAFSHLTDPRLRQAVTIPPQRR